MTEPEELETHKRVDKDRPFWHGFENLGQLY